MGYANARGRLASHRSAGWGAAGGGGGGSDAGSSTASTGCLMKHVGERTHVESGRALHSVPSGLYSCERPPSTGSSAPVVKVASNPRNNAARATSSGEPMRFMGVISSPSFSKAVSSSLGGAVDAHGRERLVGRPREAIADGPATL